MNYKSLTFQCPPVLLLRVSNVVKAQQIEGAILFIYCSPRGAAVSTENNLSPRSYFEIQVSLN